MYRSSNITPTCAYSYYQVLLCFNGTFNHRPKTIVRDFGKAW